jgi:hypothetical protein
MCMIDGIDVIFITNMTSIRDMERTEPIRFGYTLAQMIKTFCNEP